MNTTPALKLSPLPSPGLGDVLDQLTIAYAEKLDRHGPLMGFAAPQPAEPVPFAAEQARKALVIDTTSDPAGKAVALLDKEAHRHQQIGRLAYYVAGYEMAHGDAANVEPMRQLGDDHLELAEGLRSQIDVERLNALHTSEVGKGLIGDFVTAETKAANANARQFAGEHDRNGRDL